MINYKNNNNMHVLFLTNNIIIHQSKTRIQEKMKLNKFQQPNNNNNNNNNDNNNYYYYLNFNTISNPSVGPLKNGKIIVPE